MRRTSMGRCAAVNLKKTLRDAVPLSVRRGPSRGPVAPSIMRRTSRGRHQSYQVDTDSAVF